MGPRATITRASDAGVLEIDGRPALEFYERYLGAGRPPVANPLAVFDDPSSDRFYLRTPITYDRERGSILFFGAVPEGATVQLTMAATDQIFDGAKASFADALAGLPDGARPDGALLFSCATRKFLLGTRAGREIELAREVLGEAVPIGGIYCMGEIAPMASADQTRFHNATMVSVLLGSAPSGRDRTRLTSEPRSRSRDELEKENLRLTRRLERLEANVRRLEEFQDSNTTLASRLLTELEEERARSERLLLNVLPQPDRRPARGRRDADRGSPRRDLRPVQRRRRLHRDLRPPRTLDAGRGDERALVRLRRDLRADRGREDQDDRRRVSRDRRPGRRVGPCGGHRRDSAPDGRAGRDGLAGGANGGSGSASTAGRRSPA